MKQESYKNLRNSTCEITSRGKTHPTTLWRCL